MSAYVIEAMSKSLTESDFIKSINIMKYWKTKLLNTSRYNSPKIESLDVTFIIKNH